ncbi:MAG TPA: nuclear transport factor 2 family protein [Acidimicrobiales bacterium]|jgi:ketosteroid isomerase-like protein|nr:nuclear transport factor 2 family protein [Acidimicrobiales bacterium]
MPDRGSLEARVRRLEAVESARDLLHAYAAACDRGDLEGLVGLFADGAVLDANGAVYDGRAAIRQFYAPRLAPVTRHFVTNATFAATASGDIESRCLFLALGANEGRSTLVIGNYADRIRVERDGARFRSRVIRLGVATDLDTGWSDLPNLG